MITKIIEQVKLTLDGNYPQYEENIKEFGQVQAVGCRKAGKRFDLSKHIRGMIYAQLSAQRVWKGIARNLEKIDNIFCDYRPDYLTHKDWRDLEKSLTDINCGNRRIGKQMKSLRHNINVLEDIQSQYGSVDAFVTSKAPYAIATEFGSGKRFKLKEIGFTLALEYLRNVGIDVVKPDTHICRMIGPERLGLMEVEPSPEGAYCCLMRMREQAQCSAVYLDNLLWLFAATGYGEICTRNNPKCNVCSVTLCMCHPASERQV